MSTGVEARFKALAERYRREAVNCRKLAKKAARGGDYVQALLYDQAGQNITQLASDLIKEAQS